MNVEHLRRSVLAAVAAEVEAERVRARAEHDARIGEANERAAAILAEARRAHEAEVDSLVAERDVRARREARALVLSAQAEVYDRFSREAVQAVLGVRGTPDYERLCARLAADAEALLGEGIELEIDPPAVGGVVARREGRLVDYSLPALVDRAIAERGADVTRIWT